MTEVKPTSICRQARMVLGLTQTQLAERLGVARSTVAMWEREEGKIPKWGLKVLDLHVGLERLIDKMDAKSEELRGRAHGEEGE